VNVKVGCCGFTEAHHKYFANFNVVEIQNTFYQPPGLNAAKKWLDHAPQDFVFNVRAWQLITHKPSSPSYKRLKYPIPHRLKSQYGNFMPTKLILRAWETVRNFGNTLNARLVVFTCPNYFKPTKENLENVRKFFERIDRGPFGIVFETQAEWDKVTLQKLCDDLDLIRAVDPLWHEITKHEIQYFRMHGIRGRRYQYTDQDLQKLKEICTQFKEVHCLFNNATMRDDARRFKAMMES